MNGILSPFLPGELNRPEKSKLANGFEPQMGVGGTLENENGNWLHLRGFTQPNSTRSCSDLVQLYLCAYNLLFVCVCEWRSCWLVFSWSGCLWKNEICASLSVCVSVYMTCCLFWGGSSSLTSFSGGLKWYSSCLCIHCLSHKWDIAGEHKDTTRLLNESRWGGWTLDIHGRRV